MVNAVGEGRAFEVPDNAGWLLGSDGTETELASGSKALLASHVWDAVAARAADPGRRAGRDAGRCRRGTGPRRPPVD